MPDCYGRRSASQHVLRRDWTTRPLLRGSRADTGVLIFFFFCARNCVHICGQNSVRSCMKIPCCGNMQLVAHRSPLANGIKAGRSKIPFQCGQIEAFAPTLADSTYRPTFKNLLSVAILWHWSKCRGRLADLKFQVVSPHKITAAARPAIPYLRCYCLHPHRAIPQNKHAEPPSERDPHRAPSDSRVLVNLPDHHCQLFL